MFRMAICNVLEDSLVKISNIIVIRLISLTKEAIAKKSQNIKWSTTVDGKNVSHKKIRRVSLDQFYALVTGQEDA